MRIDYWILVVDDQPSASESTRESLSSFLRDEGMELRWDVKDRSAALEQELAKDRRLGIAPDLVFVDNKLGHSFGDSDGPHWALQIRKAFPFTDILFYSSAGAVKELRREIFEAGVDGVFSCNRDRLDEDAKRIIGVHIQRWLEPSATRALAVGQVVEFDEIFRRAALHLSELTDGEVLKKVAEKHGKRAREALRTKAARFTEIEGKGDVASLVKDNDLGSYWIPDVVRELAKHQHPAADELLTNFLKSYRSEVLDARNILAHGDFDSERRLFVGGNGKELSASADACKQLRVALRSYRDAIDKFAEGLTSGGVDLPENMPRIFPLNADQRN